MARETKAVEAQPTIEAKLPTATQTTTARKSADSDQSTYSVDQIIDGYRAFGYPKVIVITAIHLDGKERYTRAEAQSVIEVFANRDPLKGGK